MTERSGSRSSPPVGSAPHLSVKEKVGYSLGDAASNLYFQTFVVFLPIFYTDVFGLPAAAMGTMMLLTRLWDAVSDPVMGVIADRTRTRWGKFRPYMVALGLPLAVAGVLTFTTPELSPTGKLVYAYVTYILLVMMYTAVNVPYSALMGVMTPNSQERTVLSQYRFVAAFVGQTVIGATALTLVATLGRGNDQLGWQLAMVFYGVLAVLLLAITFFTTRERVLPPRDQTSSVGLDLKELFRNRPWVFVAVATVFQLTYIVMRGSATPYYFNYYVQDQQLSLFGFTLNLTYTSFTSAFVTVGTMATLVGAVLTKYFARAIEKKDVYARFLMASAVFSCLFFFLQPHNVLLLFGLNILVSFFFGSVSVVQWAIYTDTADYGEWKFGRRATGLIMAASLFALKLGLTFGGAFVGWLLSLHGFEPLAVQSGETILGIRLLMSVYPAVFGIVAGLIMLFYPVTNRMMVTIEEDLTDRRQAEPGVARA
jgi:glycoside/pentoside/hexuronide:cation symporter, GPH family